MTSCPLFWTDISYLSSVMVHPSSHNTPNEINVSVFIFGKMCICLACLLRPASRRFAMCQESIMLTSRSLAVISFDIITGCIIVVACFSGCIFAPESASTSMLLLVELGVLSIQLIKQILVLTI